MKLLLVGATGLVGSHVMRLALAEDRVTQVIAPVRRALPAHPRLLAPIVDFEALPEEAPWWAADAVICALGTTLRTAGSREAFYRVDHDYPIAIARLARRHGVPAFILNSAIGADSGSSFFYNRVKGDTERDLATLGFHSLTYVRPGLIGGDRQEFRVGERLATVVLHLIGPALPRRWRINPAGRIAAAMLEAALAESPGIHVVASAELV
ncbi:NAD-dependent dehydratase [Bosea sp. Tri-44]|uniref:NAD(P)H-binding protein n=1 Tax=Bosea sp. Tri-44 TaxID=1972137 RepID=UPI00100F01A5|nr:NAD(P)H-binding protein [Bosea sp. Tri-44]RXT51249.1 NAD-dependent dehydratase [Bosea sp. Tri-44]